MKVKSFMWLALAVCLPGLIVSCGKKQAGDASQASVGAAGAYKTMTVERSDKEFTRTYSATIRGRQDVSVMPQVSGTLTQVSVTEGQTVRRGQTLFVIDQVPYQAALNQARAAVGTAEASLATARLTYESKQTLYDQKVISDYELQTAKNALKTAEAAVAQARAAEVNARNNLSYTTVKSPADGVVGTLPYRQGSLVGPSMQTPLTTVSDNSQMYVYFSINENELLALGREYGSTAEALKKFPKLALMLSDGTMYSDSGRVESVSGVIDRATGTVSIRSEFPNPARLLHTGATGNVIMPSVYRDCIVIPQTATVQMQDKTLVYKVVDGKAVSTLITVSPLNDGQEYVVLSGLEAGDVIIAEGAGLIREGTQVQ